MWLTSIPIQFLPFGNQITSVKPLVGMGKSSYLCGVTTEVKTLVRRSNSINN